MEGGFFNDWEAGVENPVADSVDGFFDHPVDSPIFFDHPADSPIFFDPVDSPHLLPLDTLFQNDVDSLIYSAAPLPLSSFSNGEEEGGYPLPLPSFSDSAVLSIPPPPPSDSSTSLHRCHKRHLSSSELYIIQDDQPPPLSEPIPFYYPFGDPTVLLDEFLAPPPATMAVVPPMGNGGSSLSLQSVAARERRKRISEKTKMLGQLIPGGNRMNTAEMLQAALKYVKFLQAQVDVLRHTASIPVSWALFGSTVLKE